MPNTNKRMFLFVTFFCLLILPLTGLDEEGLQADLPVLISSCGQSPGATMIKVIFMKLDFENPDPAYTTKMQAAAEDLVSAQEEGAPYKSLIIVMGASLKGMGAAGISIEDELSRIDSLIQEAQNQGITIIGAHIEGTKRRAQGAAPGDNTDELSIDAVAPLSDILVINKQGNEDRRFSIIAEENNIPMIMVEKNLELMEKLKVLFSQ
ncbi:MAG: hypothetical protein GF421_11010 [Candidatus Aminicenantes bacterium]|nr:hypothetical protein [Candidatus Aminicenantes bacterium]